MGGLGGKIEQCPDVGIARWFDSELGGVHPEPLRTIDCHHRDCSERAAPGWLRSSPHGTTSALGHLDPREFGLFKHKLSYMRLFMIFNLLFAGISFCD